MEWRIDLILKKRINTKLHKIIHIVMIGSAIILSTSTTLAYNPLPTFETSFTDSDEDFSLEIEYTPVDDVISYDMDDFDMDDFSQSDTVIVWDDGTMIPVKEDIPSPDKICAHNYAKGTVKNHESHSDGSCTIYYYSAQICQKCNCIKDSEFVNYLTCTQCIH
jgi:hypothetical protein